MGKSKVSEALRFFVSAQFWRMGVLWTLQLIYSYLKLWSLNFAGKSRTYHRYRPKQDKAISNRPVCIITGATSGLGAAAAHELAREGFYVVLVGRSRDLLAKTELEIKQKDNDAHVKAFQVDLTSFQSMLKFKDSLQQWLLDSDMHPSIQLLINNAGILATSHRLTAESHEKTLGTNYIGAFVLTNLLLPLLKKSYIPSRVVNVTSFTHRCVSDLDLDKETLFGANQLLSKAYPCGEVYEYSKLCILLFSYELHRQLRLLEGSAQVSIMAADPGAVDTNIMREIPFYISNLANLVLKLFGLLQSPENGVNSIIDAALAPPEISGAYFFGGKGRILPSSLLSYNSNLSERLWNISCERFLPVVAAYSESR
ncbi:hypothetical protein ACHQM5_003792 [Ranunculus cassubicifolius]